MRVAGCPGRRPLLLLQQTSVDSWRYFGGMPCYKQFLKSQWAKLIREIKEEYKNNIHYSILKLRLSQQGEEVSKDIGKGLKHKLSVLDQWEDYRNQGFKKLAGGKSLLIKIWNIYNKISWRFDIGWKTKFICCLYAYIYILIVSQNTSVNLYFACDLPCVQMKTFPFMGPCWYLKYFIFEDTLYVSAIIAATTPSF